MEDDLWWKTTFDGRRPLTEEAFYGRWPLMEDNLWWMLTFDGRQPFMEDDLWWKTNFEEEELWFEHGLCWKTNIDRRHSVNKHTFARINYKIQADHWRTKSCFNISCVSKLQNQGKWQSLPKTTSFPNNFKNLVLIKVNDFLLKVQLPFTKYE